MNTLANFFENFHFLRPIWLTLLPLSVVLYFWLKNQNSSLKNWRRIISPKLLLPLVVRSRNSSIFDPLHLAVVITVLLSVSLSGPSWQKKQTPFLKNNAPIVILFELTPSMLATDVKPSRIQRSVQKIRDLIALKVSSQIAVVAYAGSTHVVTPFTEDTSLLDLYVQSLTPQIMPLKGDDPVTALKLADDLISSQDIPGTIIHINDGIHANLTSDDTASLGNGKTQILFYGIGTEIGSSSSASSGGAAGINLVGLQKATDALNGKLILNSVDDQDIEQILRNINSHLDGLEILGQEFQWRDSGYHFTWIIAGLLLLWARKGWTLRWGT